MNSSKKMEKRFWDMWYKNGAVGTVGTISKNVVSVKISAAMRDLAQKSFVLAINKIFPYIGALSQDVVVIPGVLFHACSWKSKEDDLEVEGEFYSYLGYLPDQGTVCITQIFSDFQFSFPWSYHDFFDVNEEYEKIINFQSLGSYSESDYEILEYLSDQNRKHSIEIEQINYLLGHYFRLSETTSSGKTAEVVAKMTMRDKIDVLKEIEEQESVGDTYKLQLEISALLSDLKPEDFLCADDF